MKYEEYVHDFERAWRFIQSQSSLDESISTVASKRLYFDDSPVPAELEKLGMYYASSDKDWSPLKTLPRELRLFTEPTDPNIKPRFLLEDRFIFPVRDFAGNIVALIGWYNDMKKYITTPSQYFRKDYLYFGLDTIVGSSETLVVCEGIFDTLSARALGYRAIGAMGLTITPAKKAMYPLFGQFFAIPDADRGGRKIVKQDSWSLPSQAKYLQWSDIVLDIGLDDPVKVKDLDDLVKYFDAESVRGVLDEAMSRVSFRRSLTLNL